METTIDFQANADYFTDDGLRFARVITCNGTMVGGHAFVKEGDEFKLTNSFLMPVEDLSDAFDAYNEELENFEDEIYELELDNGVVASFEPEED